MKKENLSKGNNKSKVFFVLIFILGIIALVGGLTWQNLNSDDFNNGIYYNTSWGIKNE